MKLITILFLLLLSVSPALANGGTIKGRVTDKDTKEPLIGANILVHGYNWGAATDFNGFYEIKNIPAGTYTLKASYIGYESVEKKDIIIKNFQTVDLDFQLETDFVLQDIVVVDSKYKEVKATNTVKVMNASEISRLPVRGISNMQSLQSGVVVEGGRERINNSYIDRINFVVGGYSVCYGNTHNTEEYSKINENIFKDAVLNPLSTFSVDVDYASYSNARRFLLDGQLPPKDAVRVEEFINYFQYSYPEPAGEHPIELYTELAACPWNKDNLLLHIGLKGKQLEQKEFKRSNLVFLIDVSGSMTPSNKLPLLVKAFKMFTENLKDEDVVSIVVYAGSTGLVLPPTKGSEKIKIIDVLDRLEAGGSTAGGAGMKLAYKIAEENFIANGNNRIIWATDGDFNVGVSSTADLVNFLEEKRKLGIFLTVLGFGTENIKDNRLEQMANKGNGHYAYIDNLLEAKKVLVDEIGSTLFTIAKDVKIQIEFNPVKIKAYRLVGYENRLLNSEDFEDDLKDAGEIGSGHTVTALYELIPQDSEIIAPDTVLRYQKISVKDLEKLQSEIGNLKIRYKLPDEDESILMTKIISTDIASEAEISDNFGFAAAVAMFGMFLRDSEFKGNSEPGLISKLAIQKKSTDRNGYRSEFIKLVELSAKLKSYAGAIDD